MTYTMADLHGRYDLFRQVLEQIDFSEDDDLYILGDIVDRGPEPVRLLQDLMGRANVFPVMGNHDFMALDTVRRLNVEITAENCDSYLDRNLMEQSLQWQLDGGRVTMEQMRSLPPEQRGDLLDYIADFPLYETAETEQGIFVLVHAGLGNYSPDKKLSEYSLEETAFIRSDPGMQLAEDGVYLITGHTPTLSLTGKAEILRQGSHFCIDCGAPFPRGRLACLCLVTLEAFYA